jgi:hypothetical protein
MRRSHEHPRFLLEPVRDQWVETALTFSDAEAGPALADPNGALLAGRPAVLPLAWNLSDRFAVHRIGPECQPDTPDTGPTLLVVYRNREERVEFLTISAVTQRLLQLLGADDAPTGQDTLATIAAELSHPRPAQVTEADRTLLADLRIRQILLGTRRLPA